VRDPFKIDGPTCISFSGGRTSALMLWMVLQANGGLPAGAVVVFANTGKEEEATLDFVAECQDRWGVPITWIEYAPEALYGFRQVSHRTANRTGEPFEKLIQSRKFLPNPVARFCTVELKILPAIALMRALGFTEHDNLIGFRADEPLRVASLKASPSGGKAGVERRAPMAEVGLGNQDVLAFWRNQPFDLALPVINGKTMHGNCDLCFLKPPFQRLSLINEKPSRATWWIEQERAIGGTFKKNEPSYQQMSDFARDQSKLFDPDEEAIACFCGD